MSKELVKLESFVKSTLNRQNEYYKLTDEYGQSFMAMVQKLKIKERTIASGLKIMAKEILADGARFYHVVVLLAFCSELDKHCKVHEHTWYTQEKLVEIMVNVLCGVNFVPPQPPSYYSKMYYNIIQRVIFSSALISSSSIKLASTIVNPITNRK